MITPAGRRDSAGEPGVGNKFAGSADLKLPRCNFRRGPTGPGKEVITNLLARLAVGKVAVATAVTMTAMGGAVALAANSHSGTHPDHGLAIAAQHSPSASDPSETDAP